MDHICRGGAQVKPFNAIVVAALSATMSGTTSTPARPTDGDTERQLIALEKQSWVAWQKRDGAFYQGFLSDDHVEIGTGGISTKAEIVAFVGSPSCVVKSYAVAHFKVAVFDSTTALVTYHAEQDTKCQKQVPSPAWVSSLYVKRRGKWLNAVYQLTPIPKA